jgi:hypothetical protein
MAKETKEERRARIEKEVAAESAARREAYFEAQAKSKAAAESKLAPLPKPDVYTYDYNWRQGVGTPEGEYKLTKTPNPLYDASTNEVVDPVTGVRTKVVMSTYGGSGNTTKPVVTGSSDSLYDAKRAAGYGMDTQGNQYLGAGTQGDPLTINGSPFTGTWQGKTYENGIIKTTTASTSTASTTTASIFGSVEGTSTTRSLGRDQFKNSLALFFGAAEAAKPWVDALYDVVSKFYRTGSDVNESFNLALQDARNNPALKPFTDRFKGIYALQDLKLTGKPVLVPTIAEYVVSQAKMADILTQANLGSIATDEFTTELISKGNSVTTIADKIAKVYQRIDMAPKAIKDTLGRYFPTVDRPTLARTLLLGQKGVDQLVDELEQYEVLAAAEGQGLGAINRIGGLDLGRAQEYARSGQTFASITPKFSQIARALPTTTKLSEISKVQDIGQVGLEKALISQSAKELEQLELLGEQEIARYSARAGRAELPLASQRRANRAF